MPTPPNIVVLMADDLGYGDLGCYGAPDRPTPCIDRLAAEGARLTDYYVAQAVCSASRAAFLTGCYPNRIGILGALGPNSRNGISAGEATLAEVLHRKGFATALFGKWHLGHHPQFLPTKHGFDVYFGLPYSNDMWPRHPTSPSIYPALPLFDGEAVVARDPDQRQLTSWYTDRAIRFIEQHRAGPFFVEIAYAMPHVPLHVAPRFDGATGKGLYADVLAEIDDSVGRVLDTLERLGLRSKTLVLFTSDNGPWLSYGDHAGSAGPLREGKGTTFEGGVRVPCVVRLPGKIRVGAVIHEPVMAIDWLPTLASLGGAAAPEAIDGRDIAPLLRGDPAASAPHEALLFYWGEELQAVRSGRWKLHEPHSYRSESAEPGHGGLPGRPVPRSIERSLYDLESDPGETNELSAAHPDVVDRLEALAGSAREDLGDSLTNTRGRGVRLPGQVPP
jgi:arylsulfatase A-like enzyme